MSIVDCIQAFANRFFSDDTYQRVIIEAWIRDYGVQKSLEMLQKLNPTFIIECFTTDNTMSIQMYLWTTPEGMTTIDVLKQLSKEDQSDILLFLKENIFLVKNKSQNTEIKYESFQYNSILKEHWEKNKTEILSKISGHAKP